MSFFDEPATSWNKLKKDSEDFQKPFQYSNDFQYNGEFEAEIRDLIRLYALNEEVKNASPPLRLYVNNEAVKLQSYFKAEQVIRSGESIENWGNRVFKNQDYILVINCIERFSESLSSQFAKLMIPRLENYSADEISFRITLFIGNAGFTPFGAHIDLSGLDVTHFHLGPGSKSMMLWEEDYFKKLSNSKERHCYDFKKYLENGKKYILNKGDVLFFPADKYYHLGKYHNFSMATAVGVMKETPKSILSKALSYWKEDRIASNTFEVPKTQESRGILDEYKCKKYSNVYMYHRPFLKDIPSDFLLKKALELNSSFNLIVKNNFVFSRGRKFHLPLNSDSELLLQELNDGKTIICDKSWSPERLDLVRWLFNTGSLKLCSSIKEKL